MAYTDKEAALNAAYSWAQEKYGQIFNGLDSNQKLNKMNKEMIEFLNSVDAVVVNNNNYSSMDKNAVQVQKRWASWKQYMANKYG